MADVFMQLLEMEPRAWAPILLWLAISGALNLLIAERSRVDAWAESRPRLAAVLKALRGIGFDPWHIVAAVSLAVRKRLPQPLSAKPLPAEAPAEEEGKQP